MKKNLKSFLGKTAHAFSKKARFDNAIFVFGHMRCGSTALTNILCSRPDISGYGESHVKYDKNTSLGDLIVNQISKKSFDIKANFICDKILHNRYDQSPPNNLSDALAIFLVRNPVPAIHSIRKLFSTSESEEYATDLEAAEYYISRVEHLMYIWSLFPPDKRFGCRTEDLLNSPVTTLANISVKLSLIPPLKNNYSSSSVSRDYGAGDPVSSGKYSKIDSNASMHMNNNNSLDLPAEVLSKAMDIHAKILEDFNKY